MKYLATMVVGLLLIPSFSFAATQEEQYQSLVNQLIALLTEQVHELQAQLALLQEQKVDKPTQQPILGAIVAPKPMLKITGNAQKNGDIVEVSGTLSADADISVRLLESNLNTSGQTPKFSDPIDTGAIELTKQGTNFSFSFPAKSDIFMRTAQIDVSYEGKSDYVIATEGQSFTLTIKP